VAGGPDYGTGEEGELEADVVVVPGCKHHRRPHSSYVTQLHRTLGGLVVIPRHVKLTCTTHVVVHHTYTSSTGVLPGTVPLRGLEHVNLTARLQNIESVTFYLSLTFCISHSYLKYLSTLISVPSLRVNMELRAEVGVNPSTLWRSLPLVRCVTWICGSKSSASEE
jgi:hypothetical protein